MVSIFSSLNPLDEELGKKDDDHKAGDGGKTWHALRSSMRMRRRRLIVLAITIFLIWFLFTHRLRDMLQHRVKEEEIIVANANGKNYHSETTVKDSYGLRGITPSQPSNANEPFSNPKPKPQHVAPNKGKPDKTKFYTKHYYEGEMKFYALPVSIRRIQSSSSFANQNYNVLFCAANLQSAANLIPVACDMAKRGTTRVHMAFMGRNDMSIDEILQINGIDKSCRVLFHDARPDFAPYSSDLRAASSVSSALKYIQDYMHPQALITHSPDAEDDYFTTAIAAKAKEYNIPVIQVPEQGWKVGAAHPDDSLGWIARLDTKALNSWTVADIEIVVQAPTGSSGPLIKLLDSLSKADYTGTKPPRLTIELPSEPDLMVQSYLKDFKWPPGLLSSQQSQLNIRRRLPIRSMSQEEASVRFMESFYPYDPERSHVLLLSPNTYISPLYYQQLRYYLLKLKHTQFPVLDPPLMGIALDIPSVYLNGSQEFQVPDITALDLTTQEESKPTSKTIRPHFLWEAPNPNAALYFGSAWVELHSFLSLRLAKFHSDPHPQPRKKLVSDHLPAWTEYALEFMRARGYTFFYPGALTPHDAFAVIHHDIEQRPDEYSMPKKTRVFHKRSARPDPKPVAADIPSVFTDPFLPPDDADFSIKKTTPLKQSNPITSERAFQPLLHTLPFRGPEPSMFSIPHYAWDGSLIEVSEAARRTAAEAENFRQELGGCRGSPSREGMMRKIVPGSAADLFCWKGVEENWIPLPKEGNGKSGDSEVAGAQPAEYRSPQRASEWKELDKDVEDYLKEPLLTPRVKVVGADELVTDTELKEKVAEKLKEREKIKEKVGGDDGREDIEI
ncbi:hypothetical protein BT63DRAFT_422979 [Microthyrium microscopicum]|uniref:Glycosyltransferase 2 n=1 Tax=Microthyrium microscopicum TaxID=703497 RepID=A0A6A6UM56_9PEZI|nr:hypothetical protein BT63DRAFT_422979 [Microthyrium microscopicum]